MIQRQLWQWLHHEAKLDDGRAITKKLYSEILAEEHERIKKLYSDQIESLNALQEARNLLNQFILLKDFPEFIPSLAYSKLD